MQPFSRNQRPDLLTSLINKCLVLRLLRKMHLCRSSSNVPRLHTPAIVFGNATKPSRFAHFLTRSTIPCACHAKRHLNLQSGWCFVHFDFEMCFAPQRRAFFRHLNFQKWSEREVFVAFSLTNVLRATMACAF